MPSENIIVTGFGPFKEHKINSSWVAVQELKKIAELTNLLIFEIPVEYNFVNNIVPSLWKKYDPKLVIHVGVSKHTNKIVIETCAHKKGYSQIDVKGKISDFENENCSDCLYTQLNTTVLCEALNEQGNIKACISKNAGRYLCEYIFYKSLEIDSKRTLFVHVPPLKTPYNERELAEGLLLIINKALDQLQSEENEISN